MFRWLRRDRLAVLRRSSDLVAVARAEAIDGGHEYVGTEHLLLALCRLSDRLWWQALAAYGLDPDQVRAAVGRIQLLGTGQVAADDIPLTPSARRAVERASEYARQLRHRAVVSEHILVALLGDPESVAYVVMEGLGVRPQELVAAVVLASGWPPPGTSNAEPGAARDGGA